MTDDTKDNIGVVVMLVITFLIGVALTHCGVDWSWRRQIAGHHAAEFYLDGNNYRQWRWIDCKNQ